MQFLLLTLRFAHTEALKETRSGPKKKEEENRQQKIKKSIYENFRNVDSFFFFGENESRANIA
jgi:hypothetical protein